MEPSLRSFRITYDNTAARGRASSNREASTARRRRSPPIAGRAIRHQPLKHSSSKRAHVQGVGMNIDEMIFVSVDDHVVEPPTMFEGRVPAKYADRAPRVEQTDDGDDVWVFEGSRIPNIGLNAVAGRPKDEYGVDPTAFDEMRPGCFDIHERVKDMSAGGVLACMCFPSFPSFSGRLFLGCEDKDLALAMVQAYND